MEGVVLSVIKASLIFNEISLVQMLQVLGLSGTHGYMEDKKRKEKKNEWGSSGVTPPFPLQLPSEH